MTLPASYTQSTSRVEETIHLVVLQGGPTELQDHHTSSFLKLVHVLIYMNTELTSFPLLESSSKKDAARRKLERERLGTIELVTVR